MEPLNGRPDWRDEEISESISLALERLLDRLPESGLEACFGEFDKLAERSGDAWYFYDLMVDWLAAEERWQDALEVFESCIETNHEYSGEPHLTLKKAAILEQLGRHQAAVVAAEMTLQDMVVCPSASKLVARCRTRLPVAAEIEHRDDDEVEECRSDQAPKDDLSHRTLDFVAGRP